MAIARFVSIAVALMAVAVAEDRSRGPNIDRSAKLAAVSESDRPARAALDQLRLSAAMAEYGERNADSVALTQAAKIRNSVIGQFTVAATNHSPQTEDSQSNRWLARAAALSGANPLLAALIADARAARSRNIPKVPAGIWLLRKQIKPRGADRSEVMFKGGQPALVYVHSESLVDLDLYIYDEFNNLICADDSPGPQARCDWRPRWNGSFLVDVKNKNEIEVAYEMAINNKVTVR